MSVKTELQGAMATVLTEMRDVFDTDSRLFFLKRAASSSEWVIVKEFREKALVEFDSFRSQLQVTLADTRNLTDTIAQSSYIAYGVPDSRDAVEVYEIHADRRDIAPPTGTSPLWTIWATKAANERFIVEELS